MMRKPDARRAGYTRKNLLDYRRKLQRLELVASIIALLAFVALGFFLAWSYNRYVMRIMNLSGIVKVGQSRPEVAQLYREIKFS